MPTIPIWCSENPAGLVQPPDDFFQNGYKPTTIGNNGWINYVYNQLTVHHQQPVGIVCPLFSSGADVPFGFLACDGKTLGSDGSTADYKGLTYYDLFFLLWTFVPVLPTKGTSAVFDWADNKILAIPDMRGCVAIGDIALNGEPSADFLTRKGAESILLDETELPVMTFPVNDPGHGHEMRFWQNVNNGGRAWGTSTPGVDQVEPNLQTYIGNNDSAGGVLHNTTGITIDPIGDPSPDAHNNVQPSMVCMWYVKY